MTETVSETEIEAAIFVSPVDRNTIIDILNAAAKVRAENTPGVMAAFSASHDACYKWPGDTPLDKACRAAFCEGAATSSSASKEER